MTDKEILQEVTIMRQLQKSYFSAPNNSLEQMETRADILRDSKRQEKRVDQLLSNRSETNLFS